MNVGESNPAAEREPWPGKRTERIYFTAFSLAVVLLTFVAFAPSFFLHGMYRHPAPPPFIVVHGAMMTGWVVLLVIQALLVPTGRLSWHIRLGIYGLYYAALLVPVGCVAVTISAAREVHGHTDFMLSELNVLGISYAQMLLFGAWIWAAGAYRHRPDVHKRLIVLATLSLLPNAVVRLTLNVPFLDFLQTNLSILNAWAVFSLAVLAVDALRTRRLHPVFAFGGLATATALYAAWFISRTNAWDQFWMRSLT